MNPPYPLPSSIILSNATRGIFTADFTRSLTKCVRRAFEYACNTETLVVPRGGGKIRSNLEPSEQAVLEIFIVRCGIKMLLCTSVKNARTSNTSVHVKGSVKRPLGKERAPFSTSSLISSLSFFPLVKCHFAIGPSRAGCRGGGGALWINGKESVVKSGDCGELIREENAGLQHAEADCLDFLIAS